MECLVYGGSFKQQGQKAMAFDNLALDDIYIFLAEKGGSRTLRGPYGPQTGFEDQRHHRAPSFSTSRLTQMVTMETGEGKGDNR